MKLSKAIGKMPCLCCGEAITVKQADTGTLSVSCPDCDFSGYAKTGTEAHRLTMKRITLKPGQPTPPAPPTAAPAPAPKSKPLPPPPGAAIIKKNTLFG